MTSIKHVLSRLNRRKLLDLFVRHRYLLNQGNNVVASLPWPPIEKVAIVAAAAKYLLGDRIPDVVIIVMFLVYCVFRVALRYGIGYLWHRDDGYSIETLWNRGKVPPGRVEIINIDELAIRTACYMRMDREGLIAKSKEVINNG